MIDPATLTLLTLAAAVACLLTERLRPDIVALLVVAALTLAGVLTPAEAFAGFSGPVVITITSIYVLAEAVHRTGAALRIGRWLETASGGGEARLVAAVMASGAALSLFMNNIAAASLLLPPAASASRRSGVSPSRVLLPLAYGTILGGMATLLTTTNLIVSGILQRQGLEGFGLLDFAPIGVPVVAAGIAWMVIAGRRALPARAPLDMMPGAAAAETDVVSTYHLSERLFRARIPAGSALIGGDLAHCRLREDFDVWVVAVERAGESVQAPLPTFTIHEGDILLLEGDRADFAARDLEPKLELMPERAWRGSDFESREIVVSECVLSPRSRLIGRSLAEARFRERTGMTVLAIWRGGRQLREGATGRKAPLAALRLQFGDALLLQGPRDRLGALSVDPDLIMLSRPAQEPAPPGRGWLALLILAGTLTAAATRPDLVSGIMLGGALAMVLSGLVTMDQAYQAVEWRTVFLVAGMLSIGVAMNHSGAAADIAALLPGLTGHAGPWALCAGFFGAALLLTQVMPGSAVSAIVAPLAIGAAADLGASPYPFAMAVALATSMALLSPAGHPVNALVMGPGGYRVREYFKAGFPLMIIVSAVILLLLPVFWSFS